MSIRRTLTLLTVTLVAALACDAVAQVHPEARPQPIRKRPAPVPQAPAAPALESVTHLPPENLLKRARQYVRYGPPDGFAGHKWGTTRAQFECLPAVPLSVRAAWSRGAARLPEMFCMSSIGGARCSIYGVIDSMNTRREGGGFHVLSEYRIESQGFRFGDVGVLLHPVIYQFCATWDSTKREIPENFDELSEFCGMRLLFASESLSQLRALPEDHVTQYDLVLEQLIAKFGKPTGFMKRGRAIVLYATRGLWEYAYARQNGHAKGDPLFALMHARPNRQPAPVAAP